MEQIVHVNGHALYAPALRADSVVLDLGANLGGFSNELAARFGCPAVMVEANPDLCETLRRGGNEVYNLAVGAIDGTVTFNISSNPEGSSLLPLPGRSVYGATLERAIEVGAVSLETLFKMLNSRPVDVLKIDIEGAEVAALNSVPGDLLRGVGQLSVEFHDDPTFQFHIEDQVTAVIAKLKALGFAYLQFNRPLRTNALFLGPRLGLTPEKLRWLSLRHDLVPALLHSVSRWRQRK